MYYDKIIDYGSYVHIVCTYSGSRRQKYKISEKDCYRHDKTDDREYSFSNTSNRREVVRFYNKSKYSYETVRNIFYRTLDNYYYEKKLKPWDMNHN